MNKKLVEQITYALTADGRYADYDVYNIVADTLQWLKETQIVTYTFDDPEGSNFSYTDPWDLARDLDLWSEAFPVNMQIEFREPVGVVKGKVFYQ